MAGRKVLSLSERFAGLAADPASHLTEDEDDDSDYNDEFLQNLLKNKNQYKYSNPASLSKLSLSQRDEDSEEEFCNMDASWSAHFQAIVKGKTCSAEEERTSATIDEADTETGLREQPGPLVANTKDLPSGKESSIPGCGPNEKNNFSSLKEHDLEVERQLKQQKDMTLHKEDVQQTVSQFCKVPVSSTMRSLSHESENATVHKLQANLYLKESQHKDVAVKQEKRSLHVQFDVQDKDKESDRSSVKADPLKHSGHKGKRQYSPKVPVDSGTSKAIKSSEPKHGNSGQSNALKSSKSKNPPEKKAPAIVKEKKEVSRHKVTSSKPEVKNTDKIKSHKKSVNAGIHCKSDSEQQSDDMFSVAVAHMGAAHEKKQVVKPVTKPGPVKSQKSDKHAISSKAKGATSSVHSSVLKKSDCSSQFPLDVLLPVAKKGGTENLQQVPEMSPPAGTWNSEEHLPKEGQPKSTGISKMAQSIIFRDTNIGCNSKPDRKRHYSADSQALSPDWETDCVNKGRYGMSSFARDYDLDKFPTSTSADVDRNSSGLKPSLLYLLEETLQKPHGYYSDKMSGKIESSESKSREQVSDSSFGFHLNQSKLEPESSQSTATSDENEQDLLKLLLKQCSELVQTPEDQQAVQSVFSLLQTKGHLSAETGHDFYSPELSKSSKPSTCDTTDHWGHDGHTGFSPSCSPDSNYVGGARLLFEGRTLLKGGVKPRHIPKTFIARPDKIVPRDPRSRPPYVATVVRAAIPLPRWAEQFFREYEEEKLKESKEVDTDTIQVSTPEVDSSWDTDQAVGKTGVTVKVTTPQVGSRVERNETPVKDEEVLKMTEVEGVVSVYGRLGAKKETPKQGNHLQNMDAFGIGLKPGHAASNRMEYSASSGKMLVSSYPQDTTGGSEIIRHRPDPRLNARENSYSDPVSTVNTQYRNSPATQPKDHQYQALQTLGYKSSLDNKCESFQKEEIRQKIAPSPGQDILYDPASPTTDLPVSSCEDLPKSTGACPIISVEPVSKTAEPGSDSPSSVGTVVEEVSMDLDSDLEAGEIKTDSGTPEKAASIVKNPRQADSEIKACDTVAKQSSFKDRYGTDNKFRTRNYRNTASKKDSPMYDPKPDHNSSWNKRNYGGEYAAAAYSLDAKCDNSGRQFQKGGFLHVEHHIPRRRSYSPSSTSSVEAGEESRGSRIRHRSYHKESRDRHSHKHKAEEIARNNRDQRNWSDPDLSRKRYPSSRPQNVGAGGKRSRYDSPAREKEVGRQDYSQLISYEEKSRKRSKQYENPCRKRFYSQQDHSKRKETRSAGSARRYSSDSVGGSSYSQDNSSRDSWEVGQSERKVYSRPTSPLREKVGRPDSGQQNIPSYTQCDSDRGPASRPDSSRQKQLSGDQHERQARCSVATGRDTGHQELEATYALEFHKKFGQSGGKINKPAEPKVDPYKADRAFLDDFRKKIEKTDRVHVVEPRTGCCGIHQEPVRPIATVVNRFERQQTVGNVLPAASSGPNFAARGFPINDQSRSADRTCLSYKESVYSKNTDITHLEEKPKPKKVTPPKAYQGKYVNEGRGRSPAPKPKSAQRLDERYTHPQTPSFPGPY